MTPPFSFAPPSAVFASQSLAASLAPTLAYAPPPCASVQLADADAPSPQTHASSAASPPISFAPWPACTTLYGSAKY